MKCFDEIIEDGRGWIGHGGRTKGWRKFGKGMDVWIGDGKALLGRT